MQDLPTSLCANLIAEACNIGLERQERAMLQILRRSSKSGGPELEMPGSAEPPSRQRSRRPTFRFGFPVVGKGFGQMLLP